MARKFLPVFLGVLNTQSQSESLSCLDQEYLNVANAEVKKQRTSDDILILKNCMFCG
jgi:hypothetical protein